jgi:predicted nucleic acid-binding protein
VSGSWLLDNSAWARRFSLGENVEAAASLASDLEDSRLVASLPFMLEAGYSARDASEYRTASALLASFPYAELDRSARARSLDAQSQLSRTGHYRLPPVDLMIAAIADAAGIGVLHYDSHYDLILEQTDLRFESRWLAPRGTI